MKVLIDRDGCISCGACWASCPEFYEENPDDNLSQVVEPYRTGGSLAEGDAPDDLVQCATEAAEECPVEVIHVNA